MLEAARLRVCAGSLLLESAVHSENERYDELLMGVRFQELVREAAAQDNLRETRNKS